MAYKAMYRLAHEIRTLSFPISVRLTGEFLKFSSLIGRAPTSIVLFGRGRSGGNNYAAVIFPTMSIQHGIFSVSEFISDIL